MYVKNNLPDIFQQKICCQVSPCPPPNPHKSLIKENENVNFGKPVFKVHFWKYANETSGPPEPFLPEPCGPAL